MDLAQNMEKQAECAALACAARPIQPLVSLPVRHPPYPHCCMNRVMTTKISIEETSKTSAKIPGL